MVDDFEVFDVPDTFATGVQPVESHPDFVRLIFTSRGGNERRPVAAIVMTIGDFQKAVVQFLEIDGLAAN